MKKLFGTAILLIVAMTVHAGGAREPQTGGTNSGNVSAQTRTQTETPSSGSGNQAALTWTLVTQSGIPDYMASVAYGNGRFIAVGGTGRVASTSMAYSTDGITWTAVTSSVFSDVAFGNVVFEGGKFFVYGSGRIASSTDGVNWTRAVDDQFNRQDIQGIRYVDGKYVLALYDGRIAHSVDGVTWTMLARTNLYNIRDGSLRYAGGKLFAVWGVTGHNRRLSYSEDAGITWTNIATILGGGYVTNSAIAYGDGKFVVGGEEGKMAYSTDGCITWTTVEDSTFGGSNIRYIAYSGGKFVAVGGGKIAYSVDGVTWTAVEFDIFGGIDISGIAYGAGRFVAVGKTDWQSNDGKIAYSNVQE